MPNNLDLPEPRVQDRASDLLGAQGTEAVRSQPPPREASQTVAAHLPLDVTPNTQVRDGPSPEEVEKARALAEQLDKKKK